MQNTISVFSFKSQNVRTQILGAEPWFCLGDVAEILQIQNARQLPLKDQGIQKSSVATKKGNQELLFINEPNLYRVIFRSRKAEAVKFQDWIFEEVIPQIRKTGGYQITPKTTADDRTGLRRAVAALVGRKRIGYSSAYSMIHQRFNVEAVEGIPADKLPEAVAYVHALTLHTGLAGEVPDREPLPAPLKQLGCKQAVTMWTVWHETRSILKRSVAALEVLRGYADKDASGRIAACLEGIYGKAAAR
ncbi:Bro-N domain-containing protein [Neisseria gonorrhoeae]